MDGLSAAVVADAAEWEAIARLDPFWATIPISEPKPIELTNEEFRASGTGELEVMIERASDFMLPASFGRALELGCGAGRLTQAACGYFNECVGIDVAPSVLARAAELNRYGRRCSYALNVSPALAQFDAGTFDAAFAITLFRYQPPQLVASYVRELFRTVRTGGLVVFTAPDFTPASPLPPSAMNAWISSGSSGVSMAAGSTRTVRLEVTNAGLLLWPKWENLEQARQIFVGHEWYCEGERVAECAGVPLPVDLEPGATIVIAAEVTAPDAPGDYVLQFDVLQEGVAWFQHYGSEVERIDVVVHAAGGTTRSEPAAANGYGWADAIRTTSRVFAIEKRLVEALIHDCGGALLAADEYEVPQQWWRGVRYYAVKS